MGNIRVIHWLRLAGRGIQINSAEASGVRRWRGDKSMPIRLLLRLTLLAGLMAPWCAFALGVGPMAVRSALNENLDADIPLITGNPTELMGLTVQIPRQQEFDQLGAERLAFFSKLRFSVQTPPGGPNVIKVTSVEPIRNPNFNLLLELVWPRGRLLREFTVQIDPDLYPNRQQPPPLPAPVVPLESVAAAPASTAAPRPAMDLPSAPPVSFEGASTYGPVRSGETLSGIANRVRPSTTISVPQMMSILVAGNPGAFADGNPNILRRGAILRVPTAQALGMEGTAAVPPPSAPSTLDTTSSPPPTDVAAAPPSGPESSSPPLTAQPPTDSAAPVTTPPPPPLAESTASQPATTPPTPPLAESTASQPATTPPASPIPETVSTQAATTTPPPAAVPPSAPEIPPAAATPTPGTPTTLSPSELPQEITPQATVPPSTTPPPTDAAGSEGVSPSPDLTTAAGTASSTSSTTDTGAPPDLASTTDTAGVATTPSSETPAEPSPTQAAQPASTPAPVTPATPVRPRPPVQPVVETEPNWFANPVILLGSALVLLAILALLSLPFLRRRTARAQAAAHADGAFVRPTAETSPPLSRPVPRTTDQRSTPFTPAGTPASPPSARSQPVADKRSALLMPGTAKPVPPPASASGGDPPTRTMWGTAASAAAAAAGAATVVNPASAAPPAARASEPKSVAELLKDADFGISHSSSGADDTIAAGDRRTALPETRLVTPSTAPASAGQGTSGADLPSVLRFDDLDSGLGDRGTQKTTVAAERPPLEMKPAAQQASMTTPAVIDRPEPATEPVSMSSLLPILSEAGDSAADGTVITAPRAPASPSDQPFDLELERVPLQTAELPPLEMKAIPPEPVQIDSLPPLEMDFLKPVTGSMEEHSGPGLADSLPPLGIDRLEPATESRPTAAPSLGLEAVSAVRHDKEAGLNQGDIPLPPDAHQFDFADITQEIGQPADDISLTKLDEDLRSFGDDQTLELGKIETEPHRDQLKDSSADYMETKLDLAMAFLDMGDPVGARGLLDQVLQEGDADQKQRATELLKKLS